MSLNSQSLRSSTTLFDLGHGKRISIAALQQLLPDIESALFFAKVYNLAYASLGSLLSQLFNSTVIDALMDGDHSVDLQDYLVDTIPEDVWKEMMPSFVEAPPHAEILPELWASFETDISNSIKEVADKISGTLEHLPGKEGQMLFGHMARLNKQRPTIGRYEAHIHHKPAAPNLVIFDVSGSMTEETVRTLVNDVVALSWKANAHLAIVSNSCFWWEPGSYNVDDVLAKAEYGGTHYEKLTPLLQKNWGTVITIADYDSSLAAKEYIADHTRGSIETVLDISLVNRPTFLSECVGQLANELRPLLIGNSYYVTH